MQASPATTPQATLFRYSWPAKGSLVRSQLGRAPLPHHSHVHESHGSCRLPEDLCLCTTFHGSVSETQGPLRPVSRLEADASGSRLKLTVQERWLRGPGWGRWRSWTCLATLGSMAACRRHGLRPFHPCRSCRWHPATSLVSACCCFFQACTHIQRVLAEPGCVAQLGSTSGRDCWYLGQPACCGCGGCVCRGSAWLSSLTADQEAILCQSEACKQCDHAYLRSACLLGLTQNLLG